MNIDARAVHIASTLKRSYSIALGILKIVNIQMYSRTSQTPHSKIRSISIIPYFELLNILSFIRNGKTRQIKEIAEIHVMSDMT